MDISELPEKEFFKIILRKLNELQEDTERPLNKIRKVYSHEKTNENLFSWTNENNYKEIKNVKRNKTEFWNWRIELNEINEQRISRETLIKQKKELVNLKRGHLKWFRQRKNNNKRNEKEWIKPKELMRNQQGNQCVNYGRPRRRRKGEKLIKRNNGWNLPKYEVNVRPDSWNTNNSNRVNPKKTALRHIIICQKSNKRVF